MGRTRPTRKGKKRSKRAKEAAAQKKAQAEATAQKKDLHASKEAALEYLRQWKLSRAEWRFKKVRQTFLLQHSFDPVVLPKEEFDTFLLYISALEGLAREATMKKAQEVLDADAKLPENPPAESLIEPDEEETEEQKAEREKRRQKAQKERENLAKLQRIKAVRARKILKTLKKGKED